MSYVYLASPFSHPKWYVRWWRFIQVCRVAARLMRQGHVVFCPIAHAFPIELFGMKAIEGFDFWMRQDLPVLIRAKKIFVLMLPGWEKSIGIAKEVETADTHDIPVEYLAP
jgi:hypothetical protein